MTNMLDHCTHLSDLWQCFTREHALIWERLTYGDYAAHVPDFARWLLAHTGWPVCVAQAILDLIWATLTGKGQGVLKANVVTELATYGVQWWATPFTPEQWGYDAIYGAMEQVVTALQIADAEDREEAARRLRECARRFGPVDPTTGVAVPTPRGGRLGVSVRDVLGHVVCFSPLPACRAFTRWYLHEFIPAYMQHGWYDPTTGHAPPPGHELTALESREKGRDLLNDLIPGLGDVSAGQRPSTPEGRRLLWHRIVDEDGHVEFVNDADLPDEEEDAAGV